NMFNLLTDRSILQDIFEHVHLFEARGIARRDLCSSRSIYWRGSNTMTTPTNALDKRKVQLGFIGLGLMGSRLTQRLHSAGWNVQAWNRSPGPADVVRREGVVIAPSLPELVLGSDVVLS